jgi:hypothetical protein
MTLIEEIKYKYDELPFHEFCGFMLLAILSVPAAIIYSVLYIIYHLTWGALDDWYYQRFVIKSPKPKYFSKS